jgi:UDP-glucose:(heptosyl)LPS alpha-1,3-glucosyltransferase
VFFVGEVSNAEVQQQIDELMRSYDLSSVIRQFPVTDNIIPYYHAADLIVLPSLSEGFPNVILEAFAAGKPVIASTSADAVGIIDEGVNGWHFPTGDAQALAQLLSAAWQMPAAQLAQMGENARPTAARYSVEAMVRQYTEIYQSKRSHNG